jgi:hypothetical protein
MLDVAAIAALYVIISLCLSVCQLAIFSAIPEQIWMKFETWAKGTYFDCHKKMHASQQPPNIF